VTAHDRRLVVAPDRRRAARGGRRETDRPGRHPVVLLADSYEDARSPLARYLDRFGFDVREAASADEALRVLQEHQPEVVLSGLEGHDASRFLDALSTGHAPRVILALLSAGDDPIPAVATGTMTKPFSLRPMLDELRRELRTALSGDLPAQ